MVPEGRAARAAWFPAARQVDLKPARSGSRFYRPERFANLLQLHQDFASFLVGTRTCPAIEIERSSIRLTARHTQAGLDRGQRTRASSSSSSGNGVLLRMSWPGSPANTSAGGNGRLWEIPAATNDLPGFSARLPRPRHEADQGKNSHYTDNPNKVKEISREFWISPDCQQGAVTLPSALGPWLST
jgi:hypothetical protein